MKASADPVLDWLLEESDPGVRFLAMRDLLDADAEDPSLVAARAETLNQAPVRDILEAQTPEGYWIEAGPGYLPKYRSTLWQVIFLGQFMADGRDVRIRSAVDYVLENARAPDGGFSMNGTRSGLIHCLQGNLCSSLIELGFETDMRLQEALDWMARSILGEGIAPSSEKKAPVRYLRSGNSGPSFLCSANDHKPCAWGAVPAIEALSKVSSHHRTPVIDRAIQAGIEFLLSRDPAVADYPMGYSEKPNRSWFKFGYPLGYVCDVLRNVEVLCALGLGKDPRIQNALEMILNKRDSKGRWNLEYTYAGKMWGDLGAKGQPNKWVTLRARRALRHAGVEA
ncbi:MAG TPA: nitrogen fixation protein NifH [Anaerolineae bacterium]|nr:nitrogen fixation protein NifH [Anaerolineae bacterium]